MTTRKLLDGTEVVELEFSTTLSIHTKCPQKWKLIDMETGEEYIGTLPYQRKKERNWKKINGH